MTQDTPQGCSPATGYGPCVICGDTNYNLSCGGPTICPKCDCGNFDAATVEKQARVIADLRAQLAGVAQAAPEPSDDALHAKAAVSYLIDHIEYSDSYGVHGSDFQACLLCTGGGAPGVRLVHDENCPVQKCGPIAAEWVDELNAERADTGAPAYQAADRDLGFQSGFRLALKQCAEVVRFCGECDCPRMTVDAIKALAVPSPQSTTTTRNLVESLCDDCPPVGYETDKTRCLVCPRRGSELASTQSEGE